MLILTNHMPALAPRMASDQPTNQPTASSPSPSSSSSQHDPPTCLPVNNKANKASQSSVCPVHTRSYYVYFIMYAHTRPSTHRKAVLLEDETNSSKHKHKLPRPPHSTGQMPPEACCWVARGNATRGGGAGHWLRPGGRALFSSLTPSSSQRSPLLLYLYL